MLANRCYFSVFPTYVGVIPERDGGGGKIMSIPYVCRGVPRLALSAGQDVSIPYVCRGGSKKFVNKQKAFQYFLCM